ncbi:MAG TPA: NADH-quinone oxidoreductase subunit A [Chloroflexi bacterium]|nr:MAG: NADH-quinone oxidoreductase subunit A [Anaerolineaceae bacterium 4572_5.2]HEY84193.1 NADH-quinone oxidoreductase subunit A [Chloroflexota bacterium]
MQNEFLFVGVLLLVALLLPAGGLGLAWLLRPHKPNALKKTAYECGIETIGETWVQFKVSYYIYALIFVVFDVEAVFLFPWAVAYNQLPLYALLEVSIFIAILVFALAYAWRKGALKWI